MKSFPLIAAVMGERTVDAGAGHCCFDCANSTELKY
jgi:hypothetical protein